MLNEYFWAGNCQNETVYRFIIQKINWYFERFYSWDIHKFYWCIHGNLICTAVCTKQGCYQSEKIWYEREELFSDCNFSCSHWQGWPGSHRHCSVTRSFRKDNYSHFSNIERDRQASPNDPLILWVSASCLSKINVCFCNNILRQNMNIISCCILQYIKCVTYKLN